MFYKNKTYDQGVFCCENRNRPNVTCDPCGEYLLGYLDDAVSTERVIQNRTKFKDSHKCGSVVTTL